MSKKYPCSCCSFLTLTSPETGSYEICPVCFWEDDPVQNEDIDYTGGANEVPLTVARNSFIDFGASERRFIQNVRPPMLSELPSLRIIGQLEASQLVEVHKKTKMQVLAVARGILSRHIGAIEGSIHLSSLAQNLEARWSDKMDTFVAVASETDDLPAGSIRQHWAPDALARKDSELANYETRIREHVLDACRELAQKLRTDLLGLKPVE
jgi:hypothetical protein